MSKKSSKSKNDQNPELQKQIGCVYGFFHLFDRHHFLPGRTISNPNKSLPPPRGKVSNGVRELNRRSQAAEEKNSKSGDEKHHFSVESNTSSASSSQSSSLSLPEFSKSIQSDTHSSWQTKFHESPTRTSVIKEPATHNLQCCNVHETVKDSICRKSLVVSVGVAEGHLGHPKKYIDSPRPSYHKRSVSNGDAAVYNFLGRGGEASSNCNGVKDGYVPLPPNEMARHSYDGMNIQFRSIMKLKELPRLSLDSKERMMKVSSSGKGVSLSKESDHQQTPRTSSIIAKLMGMDTSPALCSVPETPSRASSMDLGNKMDPLTRSLRSREKSEESKTPGSVCNSGRVTNWYKVCSNDKAVQATTYVTNLHEPVSKSKGGPTAPSSPISVYGEIEKRLATLEFKRSGKDLRALKHILDAMQKSTDTMNLKGDETSHSAVCMDKAGTLHERSKLSIPRKELLEVPNPNSLGCHSDSSEACKSSIMIMKAAKATRKISHHATPVFSAGLTLGTHRSRANFSADNLSVPKQAASSLTQRPTRKSQTLRNESVTAKATGEKNTSPARIAGTQSHRSRKEQFPKEKISWPSNPLTDSSRYRTKNVNAAEPCSPSTSGRQKSPNLHEGPNQFRKTRKSYPHGDDDISLKVNNLKILAALQHNEERINADVGLTNEDSVAEPATATLEQPSPVSVLDATYYRDDPPSPIKTKSISLKDDEMHHLSQNSQVINIRNQEIISHVIVPIFQRKNHPREKSFQNLLSTSVLLGESDYSHLINHGFLLELENKASKGYFGMKESYLKVEETNYIKQMQRKLIFDVAFDILVRSGVLESTSWQWLSPIKRALKKPKEQQLLAEVCCEIDKLQSDNRTSDTDDDEKLTSLLSTDLDHHSEKWTWCGTEVSETVLAVERLIFKDLINEIVVNGDN